MTIQVGKLYTESFISASVLDIQHNLGTANLSLALIVTGTITNDLISKCYPHPDDVTNRAIVKLKQPLDECRIKLVGTQFYMLDAADATDVAALSQVPAADIIAHVSSSENPHGTTAAQIGAEHAGAVATHAAANNAHAVASQESAGFMSAADKTKLDRLSQPVFGTEFTFAESLGVTSTTSTAYQFKVGTNPVSLPAGTYRIEVTYGWNTDNTSVDFEAVMAENQNEFGWFIMGEPHRQEPKDSNGSFSSTGTDQRHYVSRHFYRTVSAGTYRWGIWFRTTQDYRTASIWDATISYWRVS